MSGFPVAVASPLQVQAPWQTGRYYWVPPVVGTATSSTLGNGSLYAAPFTVPNGVTLVRIGGEITIVGDAGCTVRLGIYNDDGTGRPGTRVIDAGTIAGDSVAVQEIVISQALGPGAFWACGAVQGVTVTQPTVRVLPTGWTNQKDAGTVIPTAGSTGFAWINNAVTGALPASFGTPTNLGAGMPRIFVRVA